MDSIVNAISYSNPVFQTTSISATQLIKPLPYQVSGPTEDDEIRSLVKSMKGKPINEILFATKHLD